MTQTKHTDRASQGQNHRETGFRASGKPAGKGPGSRASGRTGTGQGPSSAPRENRAKVARQTGQARQQVSYRVARRARRYVILRIAGQTAVAVRFSFIRTFRLRSTAETVVFWLNN